MGIAWGRALLTVYPPPVSLRGVCWSAGSLSEMLQYCYIVNYWPRFLRAFSIRGQDEHGTGV